MDKVTETIETPADAEIIDFPVLNENEEPPSYHSILQVWSAVLEPAAAEQSAPVTPQWANRITSTYRELSYADMIKVRNELFSMLMQMRWDVVCIIEENPECLNVETAEEDIEHNAQHFREIMIRWQERMLQREIAWDCTSDNAAVEIATLSEVHKMLFGENGITGFLDAIGFQFTDADQDELRERLTAVKEGR